MKNGDTPSRRIGDVQISILITEFQLFKKEVNGKLDNGITERLGMIWDKVNKLPCDLHEERAKRFNGVVEAKMDGIKTRVTWLYFAFAIVILSGIVLGVWMKTISNRETQHHVSMAEGREGYRMSQMIYRDLYKGDKSGL